MEEIINYENLYPNLYQVAYTELKTKHRINKIK